MVPSSPGYVRALVPGPAQETGKIHQEEGRNFVNHHTTPSPENSMVNQTRALSSLALLQICDLSLVLALSVSLPGCLSWYFSHLNLRWSLKKARRCGAGATTPGNILKLFHRRGKTTAILYEMSASLVQYEVKSRVM